MRKCIVKGKGNNELIHCISSSTFEIIRLATNSKVQSKFLVYSLVFTLEKSLQKYRIQCCDRDRSVLEQFHSTVKKNILKITFGS